MTKGEDDEVNDNMILTTQAVFCKQYEVEAWRNITPQQFKESIIAEFGECDEFRFDFSSFEEDGMFGVAYNANGTCKYHNDNSDD